ncbi:TetR family transcriptional regulator [Actinocorallia lasiicapitis]
MSGTETKDALLKAARAEFAEMGVAGARVDRIAARAGVNKERIYGYFGSKDKLFDAVMQQVLDELSWAITMPGEDPVAYVGEVFDFFRAHPDARRLLVWEGLHDQPREHPQWRADRCGAKAVSLAKGLGRQASPETGMLMTTLIGLAIWPLSMPHLSRLFGADPADHEAMRAHVRRFAAAAIAGIRAEDEPSG